MCLTEGSVNSSFLDMEKAKAGRANHFTDEQIKAIIARLEVTQTKECPSCSHNNMTIIDGICLIPIHGPKQFLKPESVLPNIVVLCSTCGLTRLFNIYALQLQDILGIGAAGEPIKGVENVHTS